MSPVILDPTWAIKRWSEPFIYVKADSKGHISDTTGRRVYDNTVRYDCLGVITDLTQEDLMKLPQGEYRSGDIQIYVSSPMKSEGNLDVDIATGDEVLYDDRRYEVRFWEDWGRYSKHQRITCRRHGVDAE